MATFAAFVEVRGGWGSEGIWKVRGELMRLGAALGIDLNSWFEVFVARSDVSVAFLLELWPCLIRFSADGRSAISTESKVLPYNWTPVLEKSETVMSCVSYYSLTVSHCVCLTTGPTTQPSC